MIYITNGFLSDHYKKNYHIYKLKIQLTVKIHLGLFFCVALNENADEIMPIS